MSVPLPGKVTSFTVKNTLNANEIWAESINIRKPDSREYNNIMEYIDNRVNELKNLETNMKETISAVNDALVKLKNIPDLQQTSNEPAKDGEKGDKGDTGSQGPQGPQGKTGNQGLRGQKGDSIKKLSSIPDIDISDIKDGSVLMWSESKKKWITQTIRTQVRWGTDRYNNGNQNC